MFLKSPIKKQLEEINAIQDDIGKKIEKEVEKQLQKQATELPQESFVVIFFKSFVSIIKTLMEGNQFIASHYKTKNSVDYYKIQKEVLESEIQKYSQIPVNEFIKLGCDFQFFKVENDQCIFKNDRIRVYFIRKTVVDAIMNDK